MIPKMTSLLKLSSTRALVVCLGASVGLTPIVQLACACQPGMPEMEGKWMDGETWKPVELVEWDADKGRYKVKWPLRQDLCLNLQSPYYGAPEQSPTGAERIPACFRYPWEVRETQPWPRVCGKAPTGKVEDIVDPKNMELNVVDGTWLSKENSAIGLDNNHAAEWTAKNVTDQAGMSTILTAVIVIACLVALWALGQVAMNNKDMELREKMGDSRDTARRGGNAKFGWSHTAAELTREMAKVMGKLKMMKPPHLSPKERRRKAHGKDWTGYSTKPMVDLEAADGSYIKGHGFEFKNKNGKKKKAQRSSSTPTKKEGSEAESMSYGAQIKVQARRNPYHAAVATFFHGFRIGSKDKSGHKVSPADVEMGVATGMVSAVEAGMEKKTKAQKAQEALHNDAQAAQAKKKREHAPSRSPARISNVSTQLPCSRENTPRQRARTPEHGRREAVRTPLALSRSKSQPLAVARPADGRRCHSAREPVTMTKMDLGPQHDLPQFGRRTAHDYPIQQKRKRLVNRSLTPPRWDEDRMQYTTAPKAKEVAVQKSAVQRQLEKEGLVNNVAKAASPKNGGAQGAPKMSEWAKLMQ